jgi:4'-phosphopantetheinyl transferase EntD
VLWVRTNPEDRGRPDIDQPESVRSSTLSDTSRHVDDALRTLAPPWVRTGARAIDIADLDGLWPGERAAVAQAVGRRQAEFATGRALLRQLIGDDVEIRRGDDRRPHFPSGVIGTLAHDQEIAVAATTTSPSCRALGVDVEMATAISPDVASLILRPEERHLDPHLVFVLKEAVYKAWSSLGGGLLDHHEVTVALDDSGRDFTATVDVGAAQFSGRYVAVDRRHLALVVVAG